VLKGEEEKTRLSEVEVAFAALSERIMEKQGAELEALQRGLKMQIAETKEMIKRKMETRRRTAVAQIHRRLSGAIAEAGRVANGRDTGVDFTAVLTKYLEGKLIGEKRMDLFGTEQKWICADRRQCRTRAEKERACL
jgi:hypothetical protein